MEDIAVKKQCIPGSSSEYTRFIVFSALLTISHVGAHLLTRQIHDSHRPILCDPSITCRQPLALLAGVSATITLIS